MGLKFLVEDIYDTTLKFSVGGGIGLTADLRQHIWNNRPEFLRKIIKYKHFGKAVEKPRHANYMGFRDPNDM